MNRDQLLPFLKALADANRLRVVGLLAHRPHAVEELADVLELRPSTVSHHLRRLAEAGLVRSEASGHYHLYALDLDVLQRHACALADPETVRALEPQPEGLDPYDARILRTFLDGDGRIRQFPMKRKKFEVLRRHALRRCPDAGPWTEREVNARLEPLSDDTATLRRGFIDHRLMTRDARGAAYQLTDAGRTVLAPRA
jgi:biotin operon repressor